RAAGAGARVSAGDAAPGGAAGTGAEPAWRSLNAARRLGFRLLPGDAFSYVLHMRPREWPIMIAHCSLGWVLAMGRAATLRGERIGTLLAALVVVVLLVNGATLAINSAFDRDAGDVGYLDAPPPVPRHLVAFSLALFALAVAVAARLPRPFFLTTAACVVMSLLYSVPPVRLKAVAGADWLINMIGFGTLTPYAGWAASGRPLTDAAAWALVAFCPLFAALYPLTQLYQIDEDRARGDRTLAIAVGMRASLLLSIAFTVVAFACFARAAWLAGVEWSGAGALLVALGAWLGVLAAWLWRHGAMTAEQHKRGMYLALGAWAVTDFAVLATFSR
ncbi:MAG: UbiA family prenyltransferase, partial [Gemmatimonadaceae bacterium]